MKLNLLKLATVKNARDNRIVSIGDIVIKKEYVSGVWVIGKVVCLLRAVNIRIIRMVGSLEANRLTASSIKCVGELKCRELVIDDLYFEQKRVAKNAIHSVIDSDLCRCKRLFNAQQLAIKSVDVIIEKLHNQGLLCFSKLRANELYSCGSIVGEQLWGNKVVICSLAQVKVNVINAQQVDINKMPSRSKKKLLDSAKIDVIEGSKVFVSHIECHTLKAKSVVVGEGAKVAELWCTGTINILEGARVEYINGVKNDAKP